MSALHVAHMPLLDAEREVEHASARTCGGVLVAPTASAGGTGLSVIGSTAVRRDAVPTAVPAPSADAFRNGTTGLSPRGRPV